jgi:hypothetical protein
MKPNRHPSWFATFVVATLVAPLSVRGTAPVGRYIINTDTVVDTQTHLTWQRASSCLGGSVSVATAYCAGLNAGGFSTGWRLPALKELQSIVDYTTSNPAIDSEAFPGTPAELFLSSDVNYGRVGIDFLDGQINNIGGCYVRCVR